MSRIAVGGTGEPLVPDYRLEKVFFLLQKLAAFPDGLQFLTQRQEPLKHDDSNFAQEALALFFVKSPHPSASKIVTSTPAMLISLANMPYSQWEEANKAYRHYANLTDPLRPIFAGLLRRHLDHRKNLMEIN